MNKQDLIYKALIKRLDDGKPYQDPIWLEQIAEYIIEKTKLDQVVEALRYISGSRHWDGIREKHLLENLYHIQDKAEDALMELYDGEK